MSEVFEEIVATEMVEVEEGKFMGKAEVTTFTRYYSLEGKFTKATQTVRVKMVDGSFSETSSVIVYLDKNGKTQLSFVLSYGGRKIKSETEKDSGMFSIERIVHTRYENPEYSAEHPRPESLFFQTKEMCTPFDVSGCALSAFISNNYETTDKEDSYDMKARRNLNKTIGSDGQQVRHFIPCMVACILGRSSIAQRFFFEREIPIISDEELIVQDYPTMRTASIFLTYMGDLMAQSQEPGFEETEEIVCNLLKFVDMSYRPKDHVRFFGGCHCEKCARGEFPSTMTEESEREGCPDSESTD